MERTNLTCAKIGADANTADLPIILNVDADRQADGTGNAGGHIGGRGGNSARNKLTGASGIDVNVVIGGARLSARIIQQDDPYDKAEDGATHR